LNKFVGSILFYQSAASQNYFKQFSLQ